MAYQVHVFMGVCSAQTNDEAISLTEANGASYKVKLFNVAAGAQPSCTTSNLQWTYELSASGSCAPFNIIDSSGRGVVYGYGRIIVDASNPITPPNAGVYNVLRYQGSGCASYVSWGRGSKGVLPFG